jgi:quercetin dioxygenase-like cupin family protein
MFRKDGSSLGRIVLPASSAYQFVEFISIPLKKALMNPSMQVPADVPPLIRVAANEDRLGEHRGLGISVIAFKVLPQDSGGALIIENTFHAKGGPARHLHYDQDEWFYAVEGEFVVEVGSDRISLNAGDSLLAPRQVPHVWAYVGDTQGRMLIAFTPAGKMEAFFREVTKANAMPPQDPELWRIHGMELMGPPLAMS